MPLSEDDIREILRLIDESDADELRVVTAAFSLHVQRRTDEASAPRPEATVPVAPLEPADRGELVTVSAPMLGTFYRAEAPGAPPFVDVGSRVEEDTIVCLIEVMKMMNAIPAGAVGTVVEICALNAELVEHGAVLFQVRPDR
jgi:acetyl-CoA carboxylase biotin carboxyl carrier protein